MIDFFVEAPGREGTERGAELIPIDVYFDPEPPEAGGRNRIQTLPGKAWFAMFRPYGPLEPWFDKTWRLPDIEPVA